MSLGRIGYERARQLFLLAGLIVLGLIAAVMYARRIETVEVAAALLFIPIFIALVLGGIKGGVATAILATGAYAALRYPAIEAVGADRFVPLMLSRGLSFLAFGLIGGWASQELRASLEKLELYDQVDDDTKLFNAGFFIEDTDLEMARSSRYQTIFSVALVDISRGAFDNLDRRARKRALRELGRLLSDSVRNVDRVIHAFDGERHRIAAVLPETAQAGARIFTERLAASLTEHLSARGMGVDGNVTHQALTFPGDDDALVELRFEFASIDRAEHPERAEAAAAPS